jgi:hypothetical protein
MRRVPLILPMILAFYSVSLFAQHAVDPAQRYYRLICLVHLTGSGKGDDPIRPEYVPGPSDARSRAGIIAWSVLPSDDGKMAIVQLVAVSPRVFDTILADKRPEIRVFEIGKHTQQEIEAEMQKFRKNFSLDALRVMAQ